MKRAFAMLLCLLMFVAPALAEVDVVVATIGDRQITRAELDAAYQVSYGNYADGDEELQFDLRLELVNRMLEEEAERIMQEKLGFDQPTIEEIGQAMARAQSEYVYMLEGYADILDDGSMERDELLHLVESYLASMDMSLDDYTQQMVNTLGSQKLREWALRDFALTEEDIRVEYEAMVESDRTMFTAYPDEFLSCALYGIAYLYVPEGVREVQQIVVAFDADQREEYYFVADAVDRGEAEQADMDALYAQLDGRVQEIRNQISMGKDFETLVSEYSDDWNLDGAYYVCEGAGIWDTAFTQAAMALQQVGEISEPVRMSDGLHILRYVADVPAGPVDFEQVRDFVADSARYQLETEVYRAALNTWLEELNAQIDLSALE